jgi:tight adherence protein B
VTLALIIGPAATLLVFSLIAAGMHWLLESPGAARARIVAYVPSAQEPSSAEGKSLLLGERRLSDIPGLHQLLRRNRIGEQLVRDLARAGMTLRPGEYILLRCALGFMAAALALISTSVVPFAAIAAALGYAAPAFYLRWRQRRRTREFDEQLVDGLVLVANALKSGFSFMQAMQAVADEMTDPISTEFNQALIETRMGEAIDDAMVKIAERVRSTDFELVVSGMVIQRQVGGNLAEVIGNVVQTMRERHRIQREIRTLTGEQRMEGAVLSVLPLGLLLVLLFLQPSYLGHMWAETAGRIMLGAGFLLDVMGLLAIRRLIQIEV